MSRGINPKHVFTNAIRDANPHNLPSGTGEQDKWDRRTWTRTNVKCVNGTNQQVAFDVYVTTEDDPTFAEAVKRTTLTIAAGGAAQQFVVEDASSYVRVTATAAMAPGSGNAKVVYSNERSGQGGH